MRWLGVPTLPASLCRFASTIWGGQPDSTSSQLSGAYTHTHTHTDSHKQGQILQIQHAHKPHGLTFAHERSRPLTDRHLCAASDFSLRFFSCPRFCFHKLSVPLCFSLHRVASSTSCRNPSCHGGLCADGYTHFSASRIEMSGRPLSRTSDCPHINLLQRSSLSSL